MIRTTTVHDIISIGPSGSTKVQTGGVIGLFDVRNVSEKTSCSVCSLFELFKLFRLFVVRAVRQILNCLSSRTANTYCSEFVGPYLQGVKYKQFIKSVPCYPSSRFGSFLLRQTIEPSPIFII